MSLINTSLPHTMHTTPYIRSLSCALPPLTWQFSQLCVCKYSPVCPAPSYLAVLPALCMYVLASSGQSICTTQLTAGKSGVKTKILKIKIKSGYETNICLYIIKFNMFGCWKIQITLKNKISRGTD